MAQQGKVYITSKASLEPKNAVGSGIVRIASDGFVVRMASLMTSDNTFTGAADTPVRLWHHGCNASKNSLSL